MASDAVETMEPAAPSGIEALVIGCLFLSAGLALAGFGVAAFLLGRSYDQSNTWLGLFTAVGGGQMLGTFALKRRGIPELDFWQVRSALASASQTDRRLIWLQVPF